MDRRYKVFVSYRHNDSHAVARIVRFLVTVFGKDAVFHDVRSIPAGDDFPGALRKAVADSEIVLAVIGSTWIESFAPGSLAVRGDEPDWVVVELAEAFDKNIRVIPVAIHPAGLPARTLLPRGIQELAFRQARIIWPDLAFDNSVHQLVDELQVILEGDRLKRKPNAPSPPGANQPLGNSDVAPDGISTTPSGSGRRLPRALWMAGSLVFCLIVGLVIRRFLPQQVAANGGLLATQTEAKLEEPNNAQRAQIDRSVKVIRSTPPNPIKERLYPTSNEIQLGLPDYSNLEILEDNLTWDLRGISPRTPQDPPFTSYAILNRRFRFAKLTDCAEIRFEGRTTGSDLFFRSQSGPEQSHEYVSKSRRLVGGEQMLIRQLAVNVSQIPIGKEATIEFEGTYWDGLQTAKETWFGAIGYAGSDVIRMLVIFPESKPFSSYHLMTAPTRNDPSQDFHGKSVFYSDKSRTFAYWEIPFVEAGRVYQFHWKW